MIFNIATSFLVFSADAKSIEGINNDTLPCSVEWCCSNEFFANVTCHVSSATGSVDDDSCICDCDPGYFNFIYNDTQFETHCPRYCGEHGTDWTIVERPYGCVCEEPWTHAKGDDEPCDQCALPYRISDDGLRCDRCHQSLDPTSYPACDVCAENFFKNPFYDSNVQYPEELQQIMCLNDELCDPMLCNYGREVDENSPNWSPDMEVVNGTCDCKCADGYFGDLVVPSAYEWVNVGSCQYCNGKGVSFDQETLKCTACENSWAAPSCNSCPISFAGENCDQCAPPTDALVPANFKRTAYPDCQEEITGSAVSVVAMVWGSAAVVTGICVFAIWRWDVQRRRNKGEVDPELGEGNEETEKMETYAK